MTRAVQRALASLLLLVIAVVCNTAMSSSALAQTAPTASVRAVPAITASDSAAAPSNTAPLVTAAPVSDETASEGRSASFPVTTAGAGRVIDTDPGNDGGPTCPAWHHTPPHDSSVADSSRPVGLGDECPPPAGLGGLLAYQPLLGSDAIAELAAVGRTSAPRGAEVCLLHCISRN